MKINQKLFLFSLLTTSLSNRSIAQDVTNIISDNGHALALWIVLFVFFTPLLIFISIQYFKFRNEVTENEAWKKVEKNVHFSEYLKNLNNSQIAKFKVLKAQNKLDNSTKILSVLGLFLLNPYYYLPKTSTTHGKIFLANQASLLP